MFSVIFWIVVLIAAVCDFSPVTLDKKSDKLLYSDEVIATSDDSTESVFGDSTVTSKVNEEDLADDDAKKQAEELIKQIYGG